MKEKKATVPFYPYGEKLYNDVFGCGFCGEATHHQDLFAFLINFNPVRPICKSCAKEHGYDDDK